MSSESRSSDFHELMRWPAKCDLVMILGIGCVVRIVHWGQLNATPLYGLFRADQEFYRLWGLQISQGELWLNHPFEQGPLYAYFIGAFFTITGGWIDGLLILQSLIGLHAVCLVYWTAKLMENRFVGFVAALVLCAYGPAITYETTVMKTSLTLWLTALSCYLWIVSQGTKYRRIGDIGAAICIGCLCLIRENYVLMLPAMMLSNMILVDKTWRERIVSGLLPIGVVVLVTIPATIHNWQVSGRSVWITAGGGEVLYMAWGPEATGYYQNPPFVRPDPFMEHEDFRLEAAKRLKQKLTFDESSQYWRNLAVWECLADPVKSFKLLVKKVVILYNDFEVPDSTFYEVNQQRMAILNRLPSWGFMIGLSLLGLVVSRKSNANDWMLLSLMIAQIAGILIVYNFGRFRLSLVPLMAMYCGMAVLWLIQCFDSQVRRKHITGLLSFVLVIGLSVISFLPAPGFANTSYPQVAQEFHEFLNNREKLLIQIQSISSRKSSGVNALYDLAELQFAAKESDEAERTLKQILELKPDHIPSLILLGAVVGQKADFSQAEHLFRKALMIEPKNADLWANLGTTLANQACQGTLNEQKRNDLLRESLASYQQGIRVEPRHHACRQGLRFAWLSMQM